MLITKEVEIKVNACVVPYFRNLGYITGKDKMLVVPVEHLNKGSHSIGTLEELRSNLDVAIDLLDKQILSKEAHHGVLENVIEKTEEYNRFIKSIIGPQK